MNTYRTSFWLLSAERAQLPAAVNAWRTRSLYAKLCKAEGVDSVTRVEGCYAGHREASFLISGPRGGIVAVEMARKFSQESVLQVAPDARASLLKPAGKEPSGALVEPIGTWFEVPAHTLRDDEPYTRFSDGRLFAVRRA